MIFIVIVAAIYSFLLVGKIAASPAQRLALTFLAVLLVILKIAITFIYEYFYFKTYFYDLTKEYVIIKKDPIAPREITIPYMKVQDVYVDQDLFDRIFDLYDVHLSTATVMSGMEAHIDGLKKTGADGIKNLLLEKIQQVQQKTV